jgi:predicted AAA+ superfamily ATPase
VLDIRYWRTRNGFEVDFILGDIQVALEAKGSQNVHDNHIRAIKALREQHAVEKSVVVCLEKEPRMLEHGVEVLPWQNFLEKQWTGEFGV